MEVLRAIVEDFVAHREPVGSKRIVERHAFGVSAATIRNDMAQLEDEELIVAPHTSSGRIPTDKGYRLFVDQLAERRVMSQVQRRAIEEFLGEAVDLDDVLARTVRLLAQLTNQVALVQYPTFSSARLRHIELVSLTDTRALVVVITDNGRVQQQTIDSGRPLPADRLERLKTLVNRTLAGVGVADAVPLLDGLGGEAAPDDAADAEALALAVGELLGHYRQDRLVLAGSANLARTEDDFRGSIFPVLEALEQQAVLLRLFGEMQADPFGMSVSIGRENDPFGLGETSVLAGAYRSSSGELARVGVLGPTRMDYQSNLAAVRAVARYLTRSFGDDPSER
ncbi:Heat-inducible transcription repressor HrcA [Mycetocola reblochoni REB411]|uniref:Heat-inducible transcription repressor HrcA n=2 Tax=Mycetocola reblochoni TaxID=331618 RepID=A0A1R4K3Z6_9MICO|nr:Heat-inducible transcription repressor HrcA [Mycetocola reblochoni REB411]